MGDDAMESNRRYDTVSQAQNRYKADLREIQFVLFEQLQLGKLLSKEPFAMWGVDEVKQVIQQSYRYAMEVAGPLNAVGDREGCRIENGRLITPNGFKEAWTTLFELGLRSISSSVEHGGGGAPKTVAVVVEEMLSGSNTAFAMYPGLTYGAAELLGIFGTDAQIKLFASNMLTGKWGGTMCLTESHAGSDVGMAKTTATRNPDGTFSIRGTKIYISAGDHDLAENVIHLVLARIEGAPMGTKGLSLFIVPRVRVNGEGTLGVDNDVALGSIEHKMGINGSATCVLNFGENNQCIGELVGGVENAGMAQMFRMMNGARIAVGIQGVAIASTAYLNALDYARERKQGANMTRWKDPTAPRVNIIEHADVRRMLLDMKSHVEGIRMLIFKLAHHQDNADVFKGVDDEKSAYHHGQVELLTPIVKAYASDQAFRICETAIQTFGGAGYTRDYPVEQYCRDSKIFSIYEGTNHIQAMDLVGRKLGQNGGRHTMEFFGDLMTFVSANNTHPVLGAEVKALGEAAECLQAMTMKLQGWFMSGQVSLVPLASNRVLEMVSTVCVSWMLLDAACIALAKLPEVAEGHPDRAFYEGKKWSALYYARNVLPCVKAISELLDQSDTSAIDIPDASFASI
jgi:alkylation response protein AidB-like acyl-CoA dehydrogenase